MQLFDAALHFRISLAGGFDDHQRFTIASDLALPTINRFDRAENVYARSQTLGDQRVGNARRFLVIGSCDKNNQFVAHGLNVNSRIRLPLYHEAVLDYESQIVAPIINRKGAPRWDALEESYQVLLGISARHPTQQPDRGLYDRHVARWSPL